MNTSDLAKFPCVISDNVYEQFEAHDDGGFGLFVLWTQESPLRFATNFFISGCSGQYGDGRGGYPSLCGALLPIFQCHEEYPAGDGGRQYPRWPTTGNFYHDCPREWMTEADLFLLQEEARIGAEICDRSERRWALYQNVRDAIGFALCIIAAILMFVVIIIAATMPSRNTSPYIVGGSALHEMQNKSK